jgi:hypothetical protein
MANKLDSDKKTTAVAMLCEGNSIRSTERMTGIHRDTIMPFAAGFTRLMVAIRNFFWQSGDCG